MTQVTVDLEDLEAAVFAAAAIKNIEGALTTFRRDPFTKTKVLFSDAHERLAGAMRNARRAESGTLVPWDEPLSVEERELLVRVDNYECEHREKGKPFRVALDDKLPEQGQSMALLDCLAAKGCLVLGQFVVGILWAGTSDPELRLLPQDGYAVQITDRGRQKLAE